MTEPETLALLEVKRQDVLEKNLPQPLIPNGLRPEGEDGEELAPCENEMGKVGSEATTLPWVRTSLDTSPQPSAPFPDSPGWQGCDKEPILAELPLKSEEPVEEDINLMPEQAARAFVPIDPQCIERRPQEELIVHCDTKVEGECQAFLLPRAVRSDHPEQKWAEAAVMPPARCGSCGGCGREGLRAVASFGAALIIFPCLLYGAYAFLPFDAPRLPTMSSRLVYTLRCGVFATFPIILGLLVYGLSLLCFSALHPFGEQQREVEIHRRYVAQSVQLFILYFFNLAVLATYLPQDTLKLLPLLTGLFAISRLVYWLTFAVGRSFRGFGYGLTFLPLLSMLVWNLYYMFLVEPERMFTATDSRLDYPDHARAADYKPRLWG
ncbi:transmembrane protein 79 [Phascolarctos cinereus]|uniref:Transmembrane protein 79 n=1 Tax=Phascolarctos cinereus TaxID=38626 RepID=A0A6P5KNE9_PHACI|nr:transmembrane protein 79 [Phascolarctos cinereus]XP_020847197.1 transmembrane protein 79 [Phascolarctos cinereus]XP_020847198.1 transmembrane protein 79 [Phascolarctos cinereus]